MRWALDRREITLLLFSLSIFILSYNLAASLHWSDIEPLFGLLHLPRLFSTSRISSDGRKPSQWRDKLELEIFGDWAWDKDHVAGDGSERSRSKGESKYGAMWLPRDTGVLAREISGQESAHGAVRWWGKDVPKAHIVKHVPGAAFAWVLR